MGDQNLLSTAPPCFERHIKPLDPAARRAIAEVKQRSQSSVIRWVTKNILSPAPACFEDTLSRWIRLHGVQSRKLSKVYKRR
jgi:hypothetical protein